MCLATVYGKKNDTETLIMKNVTRIEIEEGKVKLFDIIGMETVVEGVLAMADLTRSIVHINCPAD